MLPYSNLSYFGNMEEIPTLILINRLNIPEPERFAKVLENKMNELVVATVNTPPGAKRFATREANFTELQPLYSLMQCTLDMRSISFTQSNQHHPANSTIYECVWR